MVISKRPAEPTAQHPALSWELLIPASLVHLRTVSQVLITGTLRHTDTDFQATLQWPRRHPLNRWDDENEPPFSPLLVAESGRQLGLALTGLYEAPPQEAHYLIDRIEVEADASVLRRSPPSAAWNLTARILLRSESPAGVLRAFTLRADFAHEGIEFASCTGHASVVSTAAYRRLRGATEAVAPPPAGTGRPGRPEPEQVGVPQARDVLLARTPSGSLELSLADACHPVFFDHPSDHVPGMVLLEAARQACHLDQPAGSAPAQLAAMALTTDHFCEWDRTTLLRLRHGGRDTQVAFAQDGRTVATVVLRR